MNDPLTHDWKHYDLDELEGLDPDEMRRRMLIDIALDAPHLVHLEPEHITRLTSPELQALLDGAGPRNRAGQVKIPRPVKQSRQRVPAPRRYKATIWHEGRTVALGWFLTEQVRDEVVTAARQRRAMGLPVVLPRPTNGS